MKHYIYLTAGFFGFSNLGGITYFHHVREFLEDVLAEHGIEAEIVTVNTLPTASIRKRAARLAETVAATAVDESAPIHLIGHSTGGLDTRMFVSPRVSLPGEVDVERYAKRVRSVVTVSTPHLGTPVASLFNSLFGQNLLLAMSLGTIYTLRFGRLPLSAAFTLMGLLTHVDRRIGRENTILEQFYRELFADFDAERQAAIHEFLDGVRTDRAAVGQLTPGAIDLLNATTDDRPGVAYGCVLTRAASLSARGLLRLRFDPYAHASHSLFRMVQLITSRNGEAAEPTREQAIALVRGFGELPSRRDNDGVVPTLSQIWGEIIYAARGDHLDVCGHFNDPDHDPPHVDWFTSGSGFTRADFEALWRAVAEFMVASVTDAQPAVAESLAEG